MGDAATWNNCSLHDQLESRLQLPDDVHGILANGTEITPYIVADSAFALRPEVMKCYEVVQPSAAQFNFNYAVIRTRRVVECAFGRLKGRFPLLVNSRLSNPTFAKDVALVACALHNWCEKYADCAIPLSTWKEHESTTLQPVFQPLNPRVDAASTKRALLAELMRVKLDMQPVRYEWAKLRTVMHGPVGLNDG